MLNHLHSNAIKKYYENPKKCLLCNKIIRVGNKKVSQIRKKIFCNLSCSSSYNNKKYPERYRFAKKTGKCKNCHRKIYYKKRKNEGGYVRKKYCSICLPIMRAKGNPISETTKEELFKKSKNYQSARSRIRRHAYNVYIKSKKPLECKICQYNKHIEICHIKDVSKFSNNTLIKEINHISNLVSLCPNHHWELDHGSIGDKYSGVK